MFSLDSSHGANKRNLDRIAIGFVHIDSQIVSFLEGSVPPDSQC